MEHTNIIYDALTFNLQLFADGAGDGGAASADTAPVAEAQAAVQGSPAAEQAVSETVNDPDAEFADLIKGKYKAQYQRTFEAGLKNRMKGKDAKLSKYEALGDMVADKYGLDDAKDIDKLIATIEAQDKAGLQERAFKNGVSEEQQRYIDDLEAKNKRYERERVEKEREDAIQRQVAQWSAQAEVLQREFPGFDLGAELANEGFVNLLNAGVDVRAAYMATHYQEIIPNAMAYTAQQVEQGVVNRIKAQGTRPAENGTSAQSAITTHTDPSKLTLQQMDELAERARRGETIKF